MLNLWCRKALSTFNIDLVIGSSRRCWISDAERRWAQRQILLWWWKCVVLNLWCRKALSTKYLHWMSLSSRGVESLMPKGVEHRTLHLWMLRIPLVLNLWCRKALSTSFVRHLHLCYSRVESLMPKGVEHIISGTNQPSGWQSVESLMPKGVEH